MGFPDYLYICEPTLNHTCKETECYAHGGMCFLTHDKDAKSPYLSKEWVEKVSPTFGSDLLPRTLQQIRSQKIQSL